MRAYRQDNDEHSLRRALVGTIRSKAAEARMRIEREENLRMRESLVDALETDAAHEIEQALPNLSDVFSVDFQAIEVGVTT